MNVVCLLEVLVWLFVSCRPYVVTVNWVIESMKLRSPAPEEEFLCTNVLLQPAEPPSPLSKKVSFFLIC